MKLGVLTNLLADVPFAEAAKYFASLGIQAVEIGCGGYPGKAHADPDVLLNDEKALNDFRNHGTTGTRCHVRVLPNWSYTSNLHHCMWNPKL